MRGWMLGLMGVAGCGPGAGDPCESSGDGFTRRDPCDTVCVETEVPCADGDTTVPGVCAGDACASDDDCDDGWGCAATDSFSSACLPDDVCPAGFSPHTP